MQPGLSGPEDLAPGEGAIMRKGLQPVAAYRDEDVSQTCSIFLVTVNRIFGQPEFTMMAAFVAAADFGDCCGCVYG